MVTLDGSLLHRRNLDLLKGLLQVLLATNGSSGVLLEGLVVVAVLSGHQDNRIASGLQGDGRLAASTNVPGAEHHSGSKESTNN